MAYRMKCKLLSQISEILCNLVPTNLFQLPPILLLQALYLQINGKDHHAFALLLFIYLLAWNTLPLIPYVQILYIIKV